MQYRNIGTTDISASVVGFGTFPLGGWLWGDVDKGEAIKTLHKAIDEGINLIDTAPLYGNGRAEELVGEAIRDRRDKVVLATKCGAIWSEETWPEGKGDFFFYADEKGVSFESGKYRIYRYLNPDSIVREVEASLKRLRTDTIDLLQTHQQDSTTPIAETMAALEKLRKQGKIRAIGSSNVSPDQMKQYLAAGTLDATQEQFSYLSRETEKNGLMNLCRENNVSFLAYTPLELGLLTGTITPGEAFPEGDFRNFDPRFASERVAKINAALERLRPIRERHDLSAGQLMLAWAISRYDKMHVLCGMRRLSRVEENVKAANVILSQEEMQEMETIFNPNEI